MRQKWFITQSSLLDSINCFVEVNYGNAKLLLFISFILFPKANECATMTRAHHITKNTSWSVLALRTSCKNKLCQRERCTQASLFHYHHPGTPQWLLTFPRWYLWETHCIIHTGEHLFSYIIVSGTADYPCPSPHPAHQFPAQCTKNVPMSYNVKWQ